MALQEEASEEMPVLKFEPTLGDHIARVCDKASRLAGESGQRVAFRFNGIDLTASPGGTSDALLADWQAEAERQTEQYRASPEYARERAAHRSRVETQQAVVNTLVAQLPAVLADEARLVAWCCDYAEAQDLTGVDGQHARVSDLLLRAGYRPGDNVGHPDVQHDRAVFTRWIVGQVLEGIRAGAVYPDLRMFVPLFGKRGATRLTSKTGELLRKHEIDGGPGR